MIVKDMRSAYERALARANRAGIRVPGRGIVRSTGEQLYAVNSATEANRWHLVVVRGGALVCDCAAVQRSRYCTHRGLVHAKLRQEAKSAREVADIAEVARRIHVAVACDETPLYRDNRPFSIFKS